MAFHFPEKYRLRVGDYRSTFEEHGNNGAGFIPQLKGAPLKFICSDGLGAPEGFPRWEHVSVSLPNRCPSWEQMCLVKSLFWDNEDYVFQLHPPQSEWISNHPYCLHLWRPRDEKMPAPPSILIGFQDLGTLRL